ncbi:MAG: hypothetical protein D6806_08415 [Deltaproteobacteria bacterium]|nr:MAG: hypothetical protein D6806_08415 [Deltaproteobacteria bacterium]
MRTFSHPQALATLFRKWKSSAAFRRGIPCAATYAPADTAIVEPIGSQRYGEPAKVKPAWR